MVKPPKTMQPEHVDISRAGRRAGSAFKPDSFRNYMARKIDMQRKQFGEPSLPPAPEPAPEDSPLKSTPKSPSGGQSISPSVANASSILETPLNSPSSMPCTPLLLTKNPKQSKTPTSALKKSSSTNSKKRGVRFAREGGPERKSKRRRTSHVTSSVIRTWNRRHGRVLKRKRRRLLLEEEREDSNDDADVSNKSALEDSQGSTTTEENISRVEELNQKVPQGVQPRPSPSIIQNLSLKSDVETPIQEETPPLADDPQLVDDDEESIEEQPEPKAATSPLGIQRSRPDLFFYGVTIKVNGYTEPDNETLKRMIQRHGGRFECYETQRVTHIVAEHLSTAKANIFKKQKNPVPVVSPRWIVDSIERRCQMPYGKYLIEEVRDDTQQKGIKEMFGASAKKAPRDAVSLGDVKSNSNGDRPLESVPTVETLDDEIGLADPEQTKRGNPVDVVIEKPPASPQGKTNKMYINGKIRTTGTDPNFLENYFNNSRLSFIGSYKQRSESAGTNAPKTLNKELVHLPSFVFHVDMDCFFAAVAIRNFPEYKDKPVVISHHGKKRSSGGGHVPFEAKVSKNSTSECATCNYKAREFGIKKGMFLGRAKELCPELVILNYDFEGYEEVSAQVSEILHQIAGENHGSVQEVSCDESYVEILQENCLQAAATAESIRARIFEATQCTASIGVAKNKFLAKLGTDRVKPNASYVVTEYRSLLENLKLRDLPGIGWKSEPKLEREGLTTVRQVWDLGSNAASALERTLGAANGKKIYNYCYGKDDRKVEPAKRVTIGAECNYGVRFDGPYGVDHFFKCLSTEVEKRMQNVGVKGRHITLKVKQRKQGAKSPPKFLGHGKCHSLSRSMEMPGSRATCDAVEIYKSAMSLFKELAIPLDDVRGMGVVISKLADYEHDKKSSLTKWLQVAGKSNKDIECIEKPPNEDGETKKKIDLSLIGSSITSQHTTADQVATLVENEQHNLASVSSSYGDRDTDVDTMSSQIKLPPMSQLHMSQVEKLPIDMQEEIKAGLQRNAEKAAFENRTIEICQSPNIDVVDASASLNGVIFHGAKPATEFAIVEDRPPKPMKQRPTSFFDEDLLPLRLFLDENHSTDIEAVQLVVKFLTICVQEGRPKDAMAMLRSIRYREDEWSTYSVLREIFDGLDDEYFRQHMSRLDPEAVIGKDNRKDPPLR